MNKNNVQLVHGTEGTAALECLDPAVSVYAFRWGFVANHGDTGSAAFGTSYYETLFACEPSPLEMAAAISGWLRDTTTPEAAQVDGHTVWYESEERAALESYLQNTEGKVRLRGLEGYLEPMDAAVALRIVREMSQYAVSLEAWLQEKDYALAQCDGADALNAVDLAEGKPAAPSLSTAAIAQELEAEKQNDPERKAARLAQLMVNKVQLTATEALELQTLFPTWGAEGAEMGKSVDVGFRFQYGGKLYEVVLAHALQADWVPTAVPNLYKVVQEEHAGTQDDPIPWEQKMELYEGKYYTDKGVLYHCTRSSGQALAYDLADLVGQYVEEVK